jgi:hypothetical protein
VIDGGEGSKGRPHLWANPNLSPGFRSDTRHDRGSGGGRRRDPVFLATALEWDD